MLYEELYRLIVLLHAKHFDYSIDAPLHEPVKGLVEVIVHKHAPRSFSLPVARTCHWVHPRLASLGATWQVIVHKNTIEPSADVAVIVPLQTRYAPAYAHFKTVLDEALRRADLRTIAHGDRRSAGVFSEDGAGGQAGTPPALHAAGGGDAAKLAARSERTIELSRLLAQMRSFTSELQVGLDPTGRVSMAEAEAEVHAHDEVAQVVTAQQERERARALKAKRDEDEHLFVEDETDTYAAHPLHRLSGDDDELQALVHKCALVVVIFGGAVSKREQEEYGVRAEHPPSKELFRQTEAAAPCHSFWGGAVNAGGDHAAAAAAASSAPATHSTAPADGGGGDGHAPSTVSALAAAGARLSHGGFGRWHETVPLCWQYVRLEAERFVLDGEELTGRVEDLPGVATKLIGKNMGSVQLTLPCAIAFVDGAMKEPMQRVGSARDVHAYAERLMQARYDERAQVLYRRQLVFWLKDNTVGEADVAASPVADVSVGSAATAASADDTSGRDTDTTKPWREQLGRWRLELQHAQKSAIADGGAYHRLPEILTGTATWTWRCGAFAAAFAPRAIKDCNLEGRPPLMKPHVFRFLTALHDALAHQVRQLPISPQISPHFTVPRRVSLSASSPFCMSPSHTRGPS